ncbi:hypothetical protein [Paenibacillus alkalitolerans]|uniref:hypothetical protein n=1 Tax=Paenibacillus alkalitolerans TaxID=2799335 RepID=UPI0018F3CA19|nr:hypothetical protein [Paenibacillus alkalitolerans]
MITNEIDIKAQLIVAKEIQFDFEKLSHSLKEVCNSISVPTFPSVICTNVLAKLYFPISDSNKEYDLWLEVQSAESSSIKSLVTEVFTLKNIRDPEQIPGIDFSTEIRFLAKKQGTFYVSLYSDEHGELCTYPLYVKSE